VDRKTAGRNLPAWTVRPCGTGGIRDNAAGLDGPSQFKSPGSGSNSRARAASELADACRCGLPTPRCTVSYAGGGSICATNLRRRSGRVARAFGWEFCQDRLPQTVRSGPDNPRARRAQEHLKKIRDRPRANPRPRQRQPIWPPRPGGDNRRRIRQTGITTAAFAGGDTGTRRLILLVAPTLPRYRWVASRVVLRLVHEALWCGTCSGPTRM